MQRVVSDSFDLLVKITLVLIVIVSILVVVVYVGYSGSERRCTTIERVEVHRESDGSVRIKLDVNSYETGTCWRFESAR